MKNIEELMKKNNPDIKMDYAFKRSLKNKLEVQSYAKLKNTKNKKINIAKSGLFSFKKDWKNIFEKPNFNFIKLLSPVFIWAFAVFWFLNFYWTDLFISEKWNNFNYEVEKIGEESLKNSLSKEAFSPLKEVEEKIRPVSETKIWIKETGLVERKVENKIKEKTIIQRKVPVPIIKKLSPRTGTDKFIKENSIVNTEEATNTEIIDLLWDTENIDNLEEVDFANPESMWDFSLENDLAENIPEIDFFIKFCEDKKWIIKDNICEYWEVKCNKLDFENNKCN